MTAPALAPLPSRLYVDPSGELRLPLPKANQRPVMDSPARFKVLRFGRRGAKTTTDFIAAVAGHGPGWEAGTPMWEGVLQGWDVVWLAKDYNSAGGIWEAEIEPRFRGLTDWKINIQHHTVKCIGGGTLHIRSAERKPLTGVRGLGKLVKGVICDEAAWWDLAWGWREVLRPILMDNHGWAMFSSTTNKGTDGGKDPETGNTVVPSYFNRLCQAVMDGAPQRTPEDGWQHFYGTAADNPKISVDEFRALLAEYTPGSLQESQEVYAKLLTGGAGLAFHEWRQDLHVVRYDPPAGWRWAAGCDWGYRQPCCVTFFASGPDGDILARHQLYVREKTPFEVGYLVGQKAQGLNGPLEWVGADSAMWAVNDGGPSIAEEFQRGLTAASNGVHRVALISAPKGPGSRAARVQLLHEHLRYETLPKGMKLPGGLVSDGTMVPPWSGPKLRYHPDCKDSIRTIPQLPIDPKNTEDVDTEAEDHAYDADTYYLQCRVPRPEEESSPRVPDDVHPGFDIKEGRAVRKPRWEKELDLEDGRREALRSGRYLTGVRVGNAHPYQEG